jgi:hypothetical protein
LPSTDRDDSKAGLAAQLGSSGPNAMKTIVPPGLKPPVRVAVSEMGSPRTAVGVAAVVRLGPAEGTTVISLGSKQGARTGEFSPSPL